MTTRTTNMTVSRMKRKLAERYAWPGGYPLYGLLESGYEICWCCGPTDEADNDPIVAIGINWETDNMYCIECGDRIESAYGADK